MIESGTVYHSFSRARNECNRSDDEWAKECMCRAEIRLHLMEDGICMIWKWEAAAEDRVRLKVLHVLWASVLELILACSRRPISRVKHFVSCSKYIDGVLSVVVYLL